MNDHTEQNHRTLTQPAIEIVGYKLRPFSVGSMDLCRQVGLTMVDGTAAVPPNEVNRQLAAFLFIHAKPLDEVLAACAKNPEDFAREHLAPFTFEVPISELFKVADFLEQQLAHVRAATVDVVEKPPLAGAKVETPPPNS